MSVKIKICGVTQPKQAREIARLGADYIGCIIEFSKSPRRVSAERAREIREAVEGNRRGVLQYARTELVGVVVDFPFERLRELIEQTGIRIWQLHGGEDVEYVKRVKSLSVEVWRVVRGKDNVIPAPYRGTGQAPAGIQNKKSKNKKSDVDFSFWIPDQAGDDTSGLVDKIVIDTKHPLHGAGGSGRVSDWDFAQQLVNEGNSVVLSGGLNSENVQEGIKFVRPSVVDTSSGVEARPGMKDLEKVGQFIQIAKGL